MSLDDLKDFDGHIDNADPVVYYRLMDRNFTEMDYAANVPIDVREVFDLIRDIKDPEHPHTLEELSVVKEYLIEVNAEKNYVTVEFVPTIPHCSLATLIGLSIKVQLLRVLPFHYKHDVRILGGSHEQFAEINKQLADKERVAAALENIYLTDSVNQCLCNSDELQALPKFIEEELEKLNLKDHPKIQYIQSSRQPIQSYRRWKEVIAEITENPERDLNLYVWS